MVAIETLSIKLKFSAKRSLLLLLGAVLGLLPCSSLYGQEADSTLYRLRVIVDGISKKEGHLVVGLMNREQFLASNLRDCRQILPVTDLTMEVQFDSLQAGDYVLMAFVKEDLNDKQLHPFEEQSAFSNNKHWQGVMADDGHVILTLPDFDGAKFNIPQKRTMRILLGKPAKSVKLKDN